MKSYNSLSEAINDLRKRGYSEDFNLERHCLVCSSNQVQYHPEHFTVDEYHRFEGMSNPDDNSIVFAISSKDGAKGLLVDAYGVYSESLNDEMVRKLAVTH